MRNQIARDKLLQYKIAEELGMRYPDYIVTNDPIDASNFIAAHKEVAVKPMSGGIVTRPGGMGIIYTHKLSSDDAKKLFSVKYAPAFFQEYIEKLIELRVTIVGKKSLPAPFTLKTARKLSKIGENTISRT